MDYIEAKERCRKLKRSLSISLGVDEAFENNGAVMTEFARICEKALNRQIGLKPLVAEDTHGRAWYSCSLCLGGLCNVRGFIDYCPNCGQKIDWEEAEK